MCSRRAATPQHIASGAEEGSWLEGLDYGAQLGSEILNPVHWQEAWAATRTTSLSDMVRRAFLGPLPAIGQLADAWIVMVVFMYGVVTL